MDSLLKNLHKHFRCAKHTGPDFLTRLGVVDIGLHADAADKVKWEGIVEGSKAYQITDVMTPMPDRQYGLQAEDQYRTAEK